MVQNPGEKVSEFSHRFLDVQHALEKLVPGIHYLNDKSDLESRQAFRDRSLFIEITGSGKI